MSEHGDNPPAFGHPPYQGGNGNDRISSDGKLILMVRALASREYDPMTLGEIAEMTGMPPATAIAKLKCMEENQWAEKVGDGYRLGAGILSIAHKFYTGAQEHARRMQEDFLRLTGGTASGDKE